MPSLNNNISFDVRFLFTGVPGIRLSVNTTLTLLEQEQLKCYFKIQQPDGIEETFGSYASPVSQWDGSAISSFGTALRLGSNQLFQNGNYTITLYADHPDYTPGEFTRSFNLTYKPVSLAINSVFDLYTPSLKCIDATNYFKSNFSIQSQTWTWHTVTKEGVNITSATALHDLAISGSYIDTTYNTSFIGFVIYQHLFDTWLTISQSFDYNTVGQAYIPQSMVTLLKYLNKVKLAMDIRPCSDTLEALYEKAAILYQHIRNKVCSQDTVGLRDYFDEFYRLTHNYQSYVYSNTNTAIPAYDFTTGCGGSGGSGEKVYMVPVTAAGGETSFTLSLPAGARIVQIVKEIKPLKPDQFTYAEPLLTLIGLEMGVEETLFITYSL